MFLQLLSLVEISLLDKILLIILYVVIISFMTFAFVMILVYRKNKKKDAEKKPTKDFESLYCYVFDFKENTVKYFPINDLKSVTTIKYELFLKNFEIREQDKFREFINNLFNKKNGNPDEKLLFVHEIDPNYKKRNKRGHTSCVYFVESLIKETKTIYFTKKVLKYIPSAISKRGRIRKIKSYHPVFYEESDFINKYERKDFLKGSIYLIKIVRKKDMFIYQNESYIFYLIINIIFKYFQNVDLSVLVNHNNILNIVFADNRAMSAVQLNTLISQVSDKVNLLLEIYGLTSYYSSVCVVGRCSDLKYIYKNAYDSLDNFSKNILEQNKKYGYFYIQADGYKSSVEGQLDEINNIIRNQLISIYFKPIVRIGKNNVHIIGYHYDVGVNSTNIKIYTEFKRYLKQFDLSKEGFSLITKNAVNTFVSQKNNSALKLFSNISLDEVAYANRLFPHLSSLNETNLVLCFNNNEFIDFEDDLTYIHTIKNIQTKGYECGIIITQNDYTLKDSTYNLFNYFIFDLSSITTIKSNSREFMNLHSNLEKFVKFNKPIVCINVYSWAIMELLIKSGINYVSSKEINGGSTLLLPLEKKAERKLTTMMRK